METVDTNKNPKDLKDFTNLYSLSKTLRFELRPCGKTLENIKKDNEDMERGNILATDEHRAESYKNVKKIIDRYHKSVIERVLKNFSLKVENENNKDSLVEYMVLYNTPQRNEGQKKDFQNIKKSLRTQISDAFHADDAVKNINKKELIKRDLPKFLEGVTDEKERIKELQLVAEFNQFTTYFEGFHKNRMNMYSADEKSTSIAYRIINDNLPRFIGNIKVFDKVKSLISQQLDELYNNSKEYITGNNLSDVFNIEYYNNVLSQSQIDAYNSLIGGRTTEAGVKIKGLNEYINEYNQQQNDNNNRLPKFLPLYKQILSDRVAISWLDTEYTNDSEVLKLLKHSYESYKTNIIPHPNENEKNLKDILQNIEKYDLDGIYIENDKQLAYISYKLYGSWDFTKDAVVSKMKDQLSKKMNEEQDAYEKRIYESRDSFSIKCINNCVGDSNKKLESYFINFGKINDENKSKINDENRSGNNEPDLDVFETIDKAYTNIESLLDNEYPQNKSLIQDEDSKIKIKEFLDSFKALQHFIKPLMGNGDEPNRDMNFYSDLALIYDELMTITPLYNRVRNYLTRKPFSSEKVKLNFDNPDFAGGWQNPAQKSCAILKKEKNSYFLAILQDRACLSELPCPKNENDIIELMRYTVIPNPGRCVTNLMKINGRTIKVNGRKDENGINRILEGKKQQYLPEDINQIRQSDSFRINSPSFRKENLTKYIDYYKDRINEYYKGFKFNYKKSTDYESFKDFIDHINQQAYQVRFDKVSKDNIKNLVKDGKLYLFQIYCKDFSEDSKGTPNLHTLYWKMLFNKENLKDVVYKLNGKAEVFYRKKSIEKENTPTHPANMPIPNKNPENKKKESTFKYDIIKNKRYTEDKFCFYVPITINYKGDKQADMNQKTREFIRGSKDMHIIGIDRGERNLLYFSVIDLTGKIIEQGSLNEIVNKYGNNTYKVNYHDLLDKKEGERNEARKNWQTIENIKELKEGYLSQAIHKITTLMIKYKAIVVLEDLNFGFMRGRQKVEKQVYQKFEKMLIDKLNFLVVDKNPESQNAGGLLKAYQLTNKFESFKKIGKQNGFLFYIPAWKTSKIDPVTGFTNFFDTRYKSVGEAKNFFNKFEDITYNKDKDWFEFSFGYNKFTSKAEGTKTKWTVCTYGGRTEYYKTSDNQWKVGDEESLSDGFKKLFKDHDINIEGNIKDQIYKKEDKDFFEKLLRLFRLTVQLRNKNQDIDYILSPVAYTEGNFFDSRKENQKEIKDRFLPIDADANGAYNIARKGLWAVQQIKNNNDNIKLAISNKEWLEFVQKFKLSDNGGLCLDINAK